MTQDRRPGFRLPWTSEDAADQPAPSPEDRAATTPATVSPPQEPAAKQDSTPAADARAADAPAADAPAASTETDVEPAAPGPAAAEPTASDETPEARGADAAAPAASRADAADTPPENDFLRDLVAAMRGVADEARRTTTAETKALADAQVTHLREDSEKRRAELNAKADLEVAGVAEWAKAEAERIRREAEQRVAARRAQLEEQLAAEGHRAEAEMRAVRDRLAEFERELDAYHAQLSEITDPAAFAAAAKRLPHPPAFSGNPTDDPPAEAPPAPAPTLSAAMAELLPPIEHNGDAPAAEPSQPAPDSLAERLAALRADAAAAADASPGTDAPAITTSSGTGAATTAAPAAPAAGEPMTTEVVVRGLGSFGAITGFRQALSGVEGVDAVSLSLGQSGEFVFRATHAPGFDVGAAIVSLEGDAARVEPTPGGALHVTLERAR